MFAGFIPNKDKARLDLFIELKKVNTTLVFYETAPRLCKTLLAISYVFENREVAVAREITKLYEECVRGNANTLYEHYTQNPPKGEIVVMIAPPDNSTKSEYDVVNELKTRLKSMSLKSAVKEVAELTKVNKNEIYSMALSIKNEN
jgi:16S rRNA (cytidine1402-2'-O)-methyltransferase